MSTTDTRSLSAIAVDIRRTWRNVNYAALPYLQAMGELNAITDRYFNDSADMIVRYFLGNARSFTGPDAKRIKAELRSML